MATAASGTATDEGFSAERGSFDAFEAQTAERMMDSTWVEQHHFNVYQRFHAMLDAASSMRRGKPSDDYFACSSDSLIKRNE